MDPRDTIRAEIEYALESKEMTIDELRKLIEECIINFKPRRIEIARTNDE